ncbi:methyl-accepting chemotaxis protein [Baaleninema sp.]|uniref:methyl-accepting chemotaxis protein n=1 Tax=Baaleninema sp. TaxID=3101197 RepID=UPI003D08B7C5
MTQPTPERETATFAASEPEALPVEAPPEEEDGGSDDLLQLLVTANGLEQAGEIDRAREIYEDIVARDSTGVWGQSASQALANLPPAESSALEETTLERTESDTETPTDSGASVSSPAAVATPPRKKRKTATSKMRLGWGTRLKLTFVAAAVVPAALTAGATLWLAPKTLPPTSHRTAEEGDRLQQRQALLALLVGGGSTLALLALTLPLAQQLDRQLREIARFIKNVKLEQPTRPLEVPEGEGGVSRIAENLRDLADLVVDRNHRLQQLEREQERDSQRDRAEKERLQQQALELLERLEAARSGNLTVEAPLSDGAIGAIADAFNATARSLRDFVSQTARVAADVTDRTHDSETAVRQLSDAARHQSQDLQRALDIVRAIADAIDRLSQSTRDAADLARQATDAAQLGDRHMDSTTESMERLRTTVANTAKKAKRLAESAQEVSQILAVVSGISEKANLLAFNAAIEAARAGERGEGFRQVADDVRGLAAQIGESAGDIERLVGSIQAETADVLDVLEAGTAEVVGSTRSVGQTQQTLRQLSELSQAIDGSLQTVARDSADRAQSSQEVNRVMEEVNRVALTNAEEAQRVVKVLQGLLEEVETLKSSVAKFQVE